MTLDTKTKELVAIGSSIAANCQPCLKYHLKIAKDSGATEEEIKDAMEIAGLVKSKSAIVMDELTKATISGSKQSNQYFNNTHYFINHLKKFKAGLALNIPYRESIKVTANK